MKLSIIIPALNEREHLPSACEAAAAIGGAPEIVVVDGGSTDGTLEWLRDQPSIRTVSTRPGRGAQLNAGATIASGDVLLFLHADCLLPMEAGAGVEEALRDSNVAGGCFLVRFAGASRVSMRLVQRGINWRTRLAHTATGDQAIFLRRSVFQNVNGFADWPLFEDIDMVARLRRWGRFAIVPQKVTISPRRWLRNGVWRTTVLMHALRLGYYAGAPPARLHRWFRDVRPQPSEAAADRANLPPHPGDPR